MEIKEKVFLDVILVSEAHQESVPQLMTDSGQARMTARTGFSLIEMVVVVAIFATVGIVATTIFFTTLRGASKSDITREVKQNGDFAISVMERMIRNAISITTCSNPMSSIQIKNPDGGTTSFSLSGTQIASTGGLLTNTKVAASALNFNCSAPSGKPPVVTVSFTLSQANAGARAEEQASINFQTTVSLRTY